MAMITTPFFLASRTIKAFSLGSHTNTASGILVNFLIPPKFVSNVFISFSRSKRSFFVYLSHSPSVFWRSNSCKRSILLEIVPKLVEVPPIQRSVTKGRPQALAISWTRERCCTLVPTSKRTFPSAFSFLSCSAISANFSLVLDRSMMCMVLRTPEIKGFILGWVLEVRCPKCNPAASISCVMGSIFCSAGFVATAICFSIPYPQKKSRDKPKLIFQILAQLICVRMQQNAQIRLQRLFNEKFCYTAFTILSNVFPQFYKYPAFCLCAERPMLWKNDVPKKVNALVQFSHKSFLWMNL